MYLTEREIVQQYEALNKTVSYFRENNARIRAFWEANERRSMTYVGSGSSYSLARSAAMITRLHLRLPSLSLAAGDLLLHHKTYAHALHETMLVALSRSGSTSELLIGLGRALTDTSCHSISITATTDSPLSELVGLSLEIPWAFDESVCQTRTVTNLYASLLLLVATIADNQHLIDEVEQAAGHGEEVLATHRTDFDAIATSIPWRNVVVLADGELAGIASEAALAFIEIAQQPATFHHVLDVRHGPMVLINENTLVLMHCTAEGHHYQQDLIRDLHTRQARVVTIGDGQSEQWDSDWHIPIPPYDHVAVRGIPFILAPQMIAFRRAVHKGVNPDFPPGLDPWIQL